MKKGTNLDFTKATKVSNVSKVSKVIILCRTLMGSCEFYTTL